MNSCDVCQHAGPTQRDVSALNGSDIDRCARCNDRRAEQSAEARATICIALDHGYIDGEEYATLQQWLEDDALGHTIVYDSRLGGYCTVFTLAREIEIERGLVPMPPERASLAGAMSRERSIA